MKGRESCPGIFCNKNVLFFFNVFFNMLESLINTVAGFQTGTLSKKRLQYRCLSLNLRKYFRASFLNNTCEQLLLEEHWILLQTVPVALLIIFIRLIVKRGSYFMYFEIKFGQICGYFRGNFQKSFFFLFLNCLYLLSL